MLDRSLSSAAQSALLAGKAQRSRQRLLSGAEPPLFTPDIVPRLWHHAFALGHLQLEDHQIALAEGHFRRRKVEFPHPHKADIVKPLHLLAVRKKTLAPGLQRIRVVQLQHFDVGDDEFRALDRRQNFRKSGDVAAGENVFRYPGIGDARRSATANGVQNKDAIIAENVCALAKVRVVKSDADVLEHADRNDAIKPAGDVAIVLEAKDGVVGSALFQRPLAGAGVLFARKSDAGRAGAGHAGEIKRHSTPTTADVEHIGAGLNEKLGGKVTLLGELRVVERRIRRIKIGAAILLVGVEKERVEPTVQIIMMSNVPQRTRPRIELLQAPKHVAYGPQWQ